MFNESIVIPLLTIDESFMAATYRNCMHVPIMLLTRGRPVGIDSSAVAETKSKFEN